MRLTIIADVTAMHDNISLRQVIKLMVSAVSVRYMYDFHLCCSDIVICFVPVRQMEALLHLAILLFA